MIYHGSEDSAVTWKTSREAFFLKGNKYWRFSNGSLAFGYPKAISGGNEIPPNLDAAFQWFDNEYLYFFKGAKY